MWRKKGEGLHQECSTKDNKEGTVGRMTKFMVAISHGSGVIECFLYEGNINAELFLQFVRDRFSHFSAREIIRKESRFCKMKTPPRIARCSRKL